MALQFDHAARRDALRSELPADVGAVLVPPGPTLRYLTGLEMHTSERPAALVLGDEVEAFVLPDLEVGRAREALGADATLYTYGDATDPAAAAGEAVAELRADHDLGERVGMEFRATRLLEYDLVADDYGWDRVADVEESVAECRAHKDDEEVEAMRRAASLIDDLLAETVDAVEVGMTDAEVLADLRKRALDSEAEGFGVGIVTSGPRTAMPHTSTSDREIEDGDPLMIDAGVLVEGYYSDITRTFAVGEPPAEWAEIYDVVREAARAGRKAVAPGVALQEADRAARRVVEEAGYGDEFTHRLGHGLGLEGHEPPYLVEGNEAPFEVGHAFTVEPGVYVEGLGGVRVEDDVVLTEDGLEVLTETPRDLRIL
jgi:Xaa-Pro dipeptidase